MFGHFTINPADFWNARYEGLLKPVRDVKGGIVTTALPGRRPPQPSFLAIGGNGALWKRSSTAVRFRHSSGRLLGFCAGKQAGINAEAVVELAFGPPYHLPTAYLAPSRPPFVRLLQSLETDRERHRENAAKMTA